MTLTHSDSLRTGILLVNLGTPDAPTPAALRRYLAEFLGDPRVVELPRLLWWPILHGIILNTRPRKSAVKYATIWTEEGSPLLVHTRKLATTLQARLADQPGWRVDWAMRYGTPSISERLAALTDAGCRRILLFPLYPQYAASTTGTVIDAASTHWQQQRNIPEVRWLHGFAAHPAYIHALAESVRRHWQTHGPLDATGRLLMSFHGLPKKCSALGDPYEEECRQTARALAAALDLSDDQWAIAFQSRFGRAEWLQPYTTPTLRQWGAQGISRVDVLCPGFVADCLETLEEINGECREAFLESGGQAFHYLPCLNEDPLWVDAVAQLVRSTLHTAHMTKT